MVTPETVFAACEQLKEAGELVSFRKVYALTGGHSATVADGVRQWKAQHAHSPVPEGEEWRNGMERFLDEEARTGRLAWLEQELPALEERVDAVQAQMARAEASLAQVLAQTAEAEARLAAVQAAITAPRRELAALTTEAR